MSKSPEDKKSRAVHDIDLGLDTLFGALGSAIGEMVSRLEDGKEGTISRDHEFETPEGPVRAHAGVRLRMGGLDAGRQDETPAPKPVNPNRKAPRKAEPQAAKPLSYDVFEDEAAWIFTADMPGVLQDELALEQEETRLILGTTGQRQYEATVDLKKDFDFAGIEVRLHNGVLSLHIPKVAS